ncbi:MAG TPA: FIST N-terminal domain-containing protein [Xanthomonadales bacterium]|nr:FIST N-terminal domain-containing protein [Xanthomonadales bacterium]
MTKSSVTFTELKESKQAGEYLGKQILSSSDNKSPDVVVVFASSSYDYTLLLEAIKKTCHPALLIGCSSAGEFVSNNQGEGAVSALAITSSEMQFSIGIGRDIQKGVKKVAIDIVSSFKGTNNFKYPYKSALVLADALAGYTDHLIDELNTLTFGTYQFFGGGAGDDAKFSKTHVFFGTKAYTNAAVTLEILSHKPLGIGVRHGWEAASKPMRVTESDGMRLVSLNAIPTVEVFKEHAKITKQKFDLKGPIPFFLHNVIGIKTVNGYQLRVPLSINSDGSIECASDIPRGATVSIMKTTSQSATQAAKDALEDALLQMNGEKAGVALFFDCVATRLRTGDKFSSELNTLQKGLGSTQYVGCNTYGQIARVDGQFSGFHNCTAVVCVIPE